VKEKQKKYFQYSQGYFLSLKERVSVFLW